MSDGRDIAAELERVYRAACEPGLDGYYYRGIIGDAVAEIRRLEAEVARLEGSGWVDVRERLPEPDDFVIVARGRHVWVARLDSVRGDWRDEDDLLCVVDRWRPLPGLPPAPGLPA